MNVVVCALSILLTQHTPFGRMYIHRARRSDVGTVTTQQQRNQQQQHDRRYRHPNKPPPCTNTPPPIYSTLEQDGTTTKSVRTRGIRSRAVDTIKRIGHKTMRYGMRWDWEQRAPAI